MKDKLSRNAEDYLKTILELSQENNCVRVKDISKQLCVKPPSVAEMMRKLDDRGYVIHERYKGVFLTPKGEEFGRTVKDRHDTLKTFLVFIGVPDDVADEDACTMEHELHSKTVEQIKNLVQFTNFEPENSEWLDLFKIFCGMDGYTYENSKNYHVTCNKKQRVI